MPLLGIFGGKKSAKSSSGHENNNGFNSAPSGGYRSNPKLAPLPSPSSHSSVYPTIDSPANSPSSSNGGLLRNPFGKKKSNYASSATSLTESESGSQYSQSNARPPRPPFAGNQHRESMDSTISNNTTYLQPPARSAMFGDPKGALSTRSLPDSVSQEPPKLVNKKSSFFNWSKSNGNTPQNTQKSPQPSPSNAQFDQDSFNLRSFRHVTGASSRPTENGTRDEEPLQPPAPRRPRGDSVASDSSQRISVAAFREAQARRSQAGSPLPPSPASDDPSRSFSSSVANSRQGSDQSNSRTASRPPHNNNNSARPPSRNHLFSGGDSSESEEEEAESDEDSPPGGVSRRRTLTQRSASGPAPSRTAKSEAGHGARQKTTPSSFKVPVPSSPPASSKSPGNDPTLRRRGSKSTGNLKQASATTSPPSKAPKAHSPPQTTKAPPPRRTQLVESDSDSDDAPLSSLIPPKRPGSAASNRSLPSRSSSPFGGPRIPAAQGQKPLIDIASLTTHNASTHGDAPSARGFISRDGRPEPMRSVTSIEPPDKNFVEPPPSPIRKTTPLSSASSSPNIPPQTVASRQVPIRGNTAMSSSSDASSSYSRDNGKRDMLSERLRGALHHKTPSDSSQKSVATVWSQASMHVKQESTATITPPPPMPTTRPVPKKKTTLPPSTSSPAITTRPPSEDSSDLAALLGGSVKLISLNGEDEPEPESPIQDSSFTESHSRPRFLPTSVEDSRTPMVVKERPAVGGFRVTSRPRLGATANSSSELQPPSQGRSPSRQRSSTLVSPPSSNRSASPNTSPLPSPRLSPANAGVKANHRISRSVGGMLKDVDLKAFDAKTCDTKTFDTSPLPSPSPSFAPRGKPMRRDSPANSSTGESTSSGRAPYTPKDGSEAGDVPPSSGVSGLGVDAKGRPLKRRSMSVDQHSQVGFNGGPGMGKKVDDWTKRMEEKPVDEATAEARRKERRRNEAKAAIELGNVINGRGPTLPEDDDEDSDEDVPISQSMAARGGGMMTPQMMNPMMNPMGMNMGMNMSMPQLNSFPSMMPQMPGMLNPAGFMPPMPNDPSMFAAHQQAMMFAKQAYQMAVAQQAMAAAEAAWETGSAMGGFGGGGGSVYGGGGGSVYGGGMGGGFSSSMSAYGGSLFPPAPASMYGGLGGGCAMSDYGGPARGGGGGFSSARSVYGENFGPSPRNSKLMPSGHNPRESGFSPPNSLMGQANQLPPVGNNMARERARTASQPTKPSSPGVGRRAPPSSWKPNP